MSIVRLKNITIGYRNKIIAENLQLNLHANEIVCLLGANGCGKTTLLKTVLGLLKPLSGEIIIDKMPQPQWSKRELARFVGYVPQSHNDTFAFSVEEIVLMGRTAYLDWYSSPKAEDVKIVLRVLQQLNIEHLRHRIYSQLSGGERQLVLIARALAQQPRLLIMDEPTSNLDFGNQIRVLEQIRQLKRQGLAILLTTHQPNHVRHVADRVILLHQSSIAADGKSEDVLTLENLSLIYQLDVNILKHWRIAQ